MKKKILALAFVFGQCLTGTSIFAQSIDPVSLIIAKVIKAIDLKVQRLQNESLVAQVAQQSAEKEMSQNKLAEITGWQDQLAKLYQNYFTELKQVKSTIAGGSAVRRILLLQQQVVIEYGRMGKDPLVKAEYDGLLNASMEVMQTLQMVVSSQLSMKDYDRVCALQTLKGAMEHCLDGIKALNKQQVDVIANRTRLKADLEYVKRIHGIQ